MAMHPAAILCRLPAVYAVALTLRDLGLDDDQVADRLGVPVESLPALFDLAQMKLAGLADGGDQPPMSRV